jgi:transitional endoplasmic reticulum ATPase
VPIEKKLLWWAAGATLAGGVAGYFGWRERKARADAKEARTKREFVQGAAYADVGGLHREKAILREVVEQPMRDPGLYERLGVKAHRGILLAGPPGCGKTLLARAVAQESGAYFEVVAGPEILSKWVGESEANLRSVFHRAREKAPAIVFLDELDAIAPRRAGLHQHHEVSLVTQLLTLMDGMEGFPNVIVIGATNAPDSIDAALRRPGRFDYEVRIGMPNAEERAEILQVHTRMMPLAADVDLADVAAQTAGYTGADLAALAREAAMDALRRARSPEPGPPIAAASLIVTYADFMSGMEKVEPWFRRIDGGRA